MHFQAPNWSYEKWIDLPENPLIGYDGWAIGDPQVLMPDEHDSQWHIFYHGYLGAKLAFFHQTSPDGLHWSEPTRWDGWTVGQNYMFRSGSQWIMYYTCDLRAWPEQVEAYGCHCLIRCKTTKDFVHWSEEHDILLPETDLEREGKYIQARNPCIISLPNGRVRLYYSAGTVWLHDAGYEEPKYIFFAEADSPLGPFVRCKEPILAPDENLPYRNYGCGAIKVYAYQSGYLAFYNPIYLDNRGASRSHIRMLASDDGLQWEEAECNPIIVPDKGWKKAIVYQLDAVTYEDSIRMYFNARDDWQSGVERIGCYVLPLHGAPGIQKLNFQNQ